MRFLIAKTDVITGPPNEGNHQMLESSKLSFDKPVQSPYKAPVAYIGFR